MEPKSTLTIAVLTGDASLPNEYGLDGRFSREEVAAVERVLESLEALEGYEVRHFGDHRRLIDDLREHSPDLALNFCDTGYLNRLSNEPNVPALLELLDIPYTGAAPAAMHRCNDKAMVRLLAAANGIPVPNETLIDLRADPLTRPELYPAIIKPNAGCGSLGITPDCVVHNAAEAEAYLLRLATESQWLRALSQDFLTGPEYTMGLVGNPGQGLIILPPLEIDYSRLDPTLPPILTYGSKADPESSYWQDLRFQRAALDEETYAKMAEHSVWLFERLGLRDYARIDYRCGGDGVPRLLDANFNPTWHYDGKMAIMAEWAGYSYGDLLGMVLDAARVRYGL
ncbi:MAG: hypothetical protein R3175_06570 [Marinobacter sp.]|uniref:D-alanine--D-alanine ligase family protein n=1 Tax=Marinobacter sp. TaxID=50741 RepID=UPI00299E8F28|nr:hypothetical protein [Marinobacter sp.]MDX1755703.1 hypothetical protein [Marinobacter sp.]